jgi:Ser/Thr protein kinase RdoA (MazF antagonist)
VPAVFGNARWEPRFVRADITAAVEVAAAFGVASTDPELLQETNNTVVWLRPRAVVAKVATRADAMSDLRLEHAIARELVAVGGEIASPLPATAPIAHEETGFVVTLWERLDGVDRAQLTASEVLRSLGRLHDALAETTYPLPSFRSSLMRARRALDDDSSMAAILPADRAFLRDACDEGLSVLGDTATSEYRLHGEPHDGNRLVTAAGLRWIDFESCCVGPREWDLAFLPREVEVHLIDIDHGLLALLRRLNSARVATWCLAQSRFPGMRRHGELHLALLRD